MDQNIGQEQEYASKTKTGKETLSPTEMDAAEKAVSSKKKHGLGGLITGIIIVALLIVAYFLFKGSGGDIVDNTADDTVAIVNGISIDQTRYNENFEGVKQNASAQGADITDPSIQELIKEQTLNGLVNNVLLIQGAEGEGINISAEEIQKEYELIETQIGGPAELASRMQEAGLTEEMLRANIEEQLLINSYIESEVDLKNIVVSDEEINEFVSTINVGGENELPPLEEIRPQIEQQILSQKQQELIAEFLDSLRDGAEIEIFI